MGSIYPKYLKKLRALENESVRMIIKAASKAMFYHNTQA